MQFSMTCGPKRRCKPESSAKPRTRSSSQRRRLRTRRRRGETPSSRREADTWSRWRMDKRKWVDSVSIEVRRNWLSGRRGPAESCLPYSWVCPVGEWTRRRSCRGAWLWRRTWFHEPGRPFNRVGYSGLKYIAESYGDLANFEGQNVIKGRAEGNLEKTPLLSPRKCD